MDKHLSLIDAITRRDINTFRKLFNESEKDLDDDMEAILAYAVLSGRRQIVEFLIMERQRRIELPHSGVCDCFRCEQRRKDPFLNHAYVTGPLSALVSPLYILSLSEQPDPIRFCIKISQSLEYLSRRVKDRLMDKLEETVNVFLSGVRDETEAEALLLREGQSGKYATGKAAKLGLVYRLFNSPLNNNVAHPTCQNVIYRMWTDGFASWKNKRQDRPLRLFLAACVSIMITPIVVVFPIPSLTRVFDCPSFSYLSDGLSHILHLIYTIVFIVESHNIVTTLVKDRMCGEDLHIWYYVSISILISINVGRLVGNISMLWRRPRMWWAAFDMFELLCLVATVTQLAGLTTILSWISRLDTVLGINTTMPDSCACLIAKNLLQRRSCKATYHYNQKVVCEGQAGWEVLVYDDLSLIEPYVTASMMHSITILCLTLFICKLMYMFERVGFIVVSLEKVMKDVLRFFYIIIVVMVAWTGGLTCIYSLFPCENSNFFETRNTIKILLWAIFGMSDTDAAKLTGDTNSNVLVMVNEFGFVLYISFVTVSTVILINILIAMMSSTYERSECRKEYLWLRKKTELQMKYICGGTWFAPPFNLLLPFYRLMILVRDYARDLCFEKETKSEEQQIQEEQMRANAIHRIYCRARQEIVHLYPG